MCTGGAGLTLSLPLPPAPQAQAKFFKDKKAKQAAAGLADCIYRNYHETLDQETRPNLQLSIPEDLTGACCPPHQTSSSPFCAPLPLPLSLRIRQKSHQWSNLQPMTST